MSHSKTLDEIIKELNTETTSGLTESQVQEKLETHGENRLRAQKKKSNFSRFLNQFKDVMIIILLIAAAISFSLALHSGHTSEFFEPVLILLIVVMNAIIGTLQESKAEKALEALKNMSAPTARVIRSGNESIIDAALLVPGDLIKLEAGDFVPADARLVRSASLKAEESALTGESVPVEKDALAEIPADSPIGDRVNMVFSGCGITYGTATAIVTATGMKTEMGKIADLLSSETETQTPLQQKFAQLGKYLGIIALIACAIVFVVGIIDKIPPLEIFMVSVSLAVSAIPEGLPAIVTIVLSVGVQRMVKKNAIIRRLPAVETLGSASIICSDKTGTLTQNRMTLTHAYPDGALLEEIPSSENSPNVKNLLKHGSLCCDGTVTFDGQKETHIGDPTETAIVLAAHKLGFPKDNLVEEHPRLAELPFDSDRKRMSTVHEINGKITVIVKGAFDSLAPLCIAGDTSAAAKINEELSQKALRVLALAYKELDKLPENPTIEDFEKDLIFMGLVGMIDPPRPEAKVAVATCREAGIKPVMITGDHILTASAIASDLGILEDQDRAIIGSELDQMSDEELAEAVSQISVYARVSPENKIRIVKAWQKRNQIVAMTGDGVNDAPALKAADIGCAMGITGTDVAKSAADMTLTDDNFSTIVDAVREGRGIYANIQKVIGYLLSTNVGEILTVFLAMLLWAKTPLVSMQLLWINLVTDALPAIALGMEDVEPGAMQQKPKPKGEGIFAGGLGLRIIIQGILFSGLTLSAFAIGERFGGTIHHGQTMAFAVLSMCQVVHAFNMRSNRSIFKIGPFTNKTLNLAALSSLLLVVLVLFVPPVSQAFELVTLTPKLYLTALALALTPLPVIEIKKLFIAMGSSQKSQ